MRCARSPDIFVSRERVYIIYTMYNGLRRLRSKNGSCKLFKEGGGAGRDISLYIYIISFCLVQLHEMFISYNWILRKNVKSDVFD